MGFWKLGVAVVASTLGLAGIAQAVPLGLTSGRPDITADGITTTYIAGGGSGNFTADGFANALAYNLIGPPDHFITFSAVNYSIIATIDAAGFASDASITVTGAVDGVGPDNTVLLTGTLHNHDFGFGSATDAFEFRFDVTGGSLAPDFGSLAGVTLSTGAQDPGNFQGNFTSSFTNEQNADSNSDLFAIRTPVPEPVTVATGALALGGLGLGSLRRRVSR